MLKDTLSDSCNQLIELHRHRQDLHRTEKALTLRIKAKCRRVCEGDKKRAEVLYKAIFGKAEHEYAFELMVVTEPFISARSLIKAQRTEVEKQMVEVAKQLPVAKWVESVRGLGLLGLASIIGECGDLSNYPTVAKVWKRLGLAVINGERQQKKAGAEAIEHGYSPSRRSVVWTVGESLFKSGGHYADVLRERKAYEKRKAEEQGLIVCPFAKIPKIPKKGKEDYRSDGHIHNRAKRYMEKCLIRDLWEAWNTTK